MGVRWHLQMDRELPLQNLWKRHHHGGTQGCPRDSVTVWGLLSESAAFGMDIVLFSPSYFSATGVGHRSSPVPDRRSIRATW